MYVIALLVISFGTCLGQETTGSEEPANMEPTTVMPDAGDKGSSADGDYIRRDSYRFSFKAGDQTREEEGKYVDGIWTVTGKITWISPDGVRHAQSYVANDKGMVIHDEGLVKPPLLRSGLSLGALASLTG